MDKKLLIGNWKSNKTKQEALDFFQAFKESISKVNLDSHEIVIAPPFTLLSVCREAIDRLELPISLASQNVSSFPAGAYTGEVNAKQVKEFAQYVIIGHSERHKYLKEDENDVANKIREAKAEGLITIQCIQDENSMVHDDVDVVAYEPPTSIGSGNPDDPQHVQEVFIKVLGQSKALRILYGGSVNPSTYQQFLSIKKLGGFLIGGASLEADSFISLLS